MKFVDFFAGVGGMRLGMEQAGHECVGFCEFDKFALRAYKAIHNTTDEWEAHDVRKIKPYDIPTASIWCFGFPCQDISIAGTRRGIRGGTRSGLFWEIMRLLAGRSEEDRPEWLVVENVKNLLSIGRGFDFARVLCALGEVGYDCEWQVLNSKDFGVPQNRERVFVVGHFGAGCGRKVFPIRPTDGENPCKLQEITKGLSDGNRMYNSSGLARTLKSEGGGLGAKTGLYAIDLTFNEPKITQSSRCLMARYSKGYSTRQAASTGVLICPVLTPDRAEKRQNGRRIKEDGEPMFTLTAQDRHGVLVKEATQKGFAVAEIGDSINVGQPNSKTRRGRIGKKIANTLTTQQEMATFDGARIRKLTPRECWRLQGVQDELFDRAVAAGISDTQLYKQAGNMVTVTVARAIGLKLKEFEDDGKEV